MGIIIIRHVDAGGYVVSTGHQLVDEAVFEASNTSTGDAEALRRALQNVIERLEMSGTNDSARVCVVLKLITDRADV